MDDPLRAAALDPATDPDALRALIARTPALALLVAANPRATPAQLAVVAPPTGRDAVSYDRSIAAALAGNPGAPPELLLRAGAWSPATLLVNPVLPLLLLEEPGLLARASEGLARALAWPRPGDATVLASLAMHPSTTVLRDVAVHPDAPPSTLAALARHVDYAVQLAVARNPATPTSVIAQLVEGENSAVRSEIAKSPRAPADVIARLVRAGSRPDLFEPASARPAIAPADRAALLASGPYARYLVAMDPTTPADDLARLAADASANVRGAVAANRGTPPEALAGLAADRDSWVVVLAVAHPRLPAALRESLDPAQSSTVAEGLARNPETPRPVLEAALRGHPEHRGVLEAIAARGAAVLDLLVQYPAAFEHYARAARVAQLAPRDVATTLAGMTHWEARVTAARDAACPPEVLARLASDKSCKVRRSVARHPATPVEALRVLAKDDDPTTRTRAAKRLEPARPTRRARP